MSEAFINHSLTAQPWRALARDKSEPRWLTAVLILFFAANVYDMAGTFGLKYAAFILAVAFSLTVLKYVNLSAKELAAGMLLFVCWPVWSLLYGSARGADVPLGFSQITPFLFGVVLSILLCAAGKNRPLQLLYLCLLSLAVVQILFFFIVLVFPENPLTATIYGHFINLDEVQGFFGTRVLEGAEVPNIYFRSTLFLAPAFVYFLFSRRTLRAAIVFLGLALTFSKAGIMIALGFALIDCVLLPFSRSETQTNTGSEAVSGGRLRKSLPLLFLAGVALCLSLLFPDFSREIHDAVTGESETALIREGHIDSILKLFARNPHYLVLGQGVGLPFFSSGEAGDVQNIEVDHLNTIRKFGLPWFLGFSALVFLPAWNLISSGGMEMRAFGFALISAYLAAGTNPVLTSPLFILLMVASYFAQRGVK